MANKSEFHIPDSVDLDALEEDQRERVSALIVAVQNGELSPVVLLERFAKSVKGDKVLNADYWDIPIVFHDILAIPDTEEINKSIDMLFEKIEHLEAKLRNHRHDTTKTFSAKPEF
jgi:hypothetical protein